MMTPDPSGMNRRAMLKAVAAAGLAAAVPKTLFGQTPDRGALHFVADYLETLARSDGGYGWEGQARAHLTPTFAVIGCYQLINKTPPKRAALTRFVRTHHPSQLKKLEQEHREFEFQQIQSLVWLGEDASSFREQVARWKKPNVYLKQYEQHGWPIFAHEITVFTCRGLLNLPLDDLAPAYTDYLDSHRRTNGSFNNTPADDGSDGHVVNTWWGLRALQVLGRAEKNKAGTIAWLQACQLSSGAFTWQPKPPFGGMDDVAYTWAATRSLQLLGAAPAQREAVIDYLKSLANPDGGFGDRPGWLSNPVATYYALDALAALNALPFESSLVRARRKRTPPRTAVLPPGLKVFSIQLEAHGTGSPVEAVDLARALHIHLWGAKNASAKWLAAAQSIADREKVPVRFFVANEEYGTWVNVPGLGTYSHTSDIIAPAGSDFGPALANRDPVSWAEFRQRRLAPLEKGGGRLIWQFGENEALVRLFLDDSLQRGGYAAISTFHFGNPDFTNSEPFLQRYRGRIPFVALQDAHGEEPWWFADMTTGFRTVFLALEPTWAGWLKALQNNWVAAVRHDAVSGFNTWMHAGRSEVIDFVHDHELSWRWWDNPRIQRPLVSIVAVSPLDEFEAARPAEGITLRVRCAWENTAQGRPKTPITELVTLKLDGAETHFRRVTVPAGAQGGHKDNYYEVHLADPAPGKHTVAAVVRNLQTGGMLARRLEFSVARSH